MHLHRSTSPHIYHSLANHKFTSATLACTTQVVEGIAEKKESQLKHFKNKQGQMFQTDHHTNVSRAIIQIGL